MGLRWGLFLAVASFAVLSLAILSKLFGTISLFFVIIACSIVAILGILHDIGFFDRFDREIEVESPFAPATIK